MIKEKKRENIIVKPKIQQKNKTIKKLIKEKVDIKNIAMRITKFKKENNETVMN